MIRPLRSAHRRLVLGLGLLAPVAFVAALLARPEPPASTLPTALERSSAEGGNELWRDDGLWESLGIRVLLYDAAPALGIETRTPLDAPDVLVYLEVGPEPATSAPGEGSTLLGGLGLPARYRFEPPVTGLTTDAATRRLRFYSLGHGETLATVELPTARAGSGAGVP